MRLRWSRRPRAGLTVTSRHRQSTVALAAVTFRPAAFAAGVDFFGISNWVRTFRSIPAWWGSFRKALYSEMGDPNGADSVRLYRVSPLFHAAAIRKPLLVLQGANDPRVLKV